MIQGVDFLGHGPTPAQLRAAGKTFTLGYLDRLDSTLTKAAIDVRRAAGIDVGLIAEWGAQRMLGGHGAGIVDGRRARDAMRALGAPAGTACYFAADWNATSAQMAAIDAYLDGAATVLGHANVGVYGGRAVIVHCKYRQSASYFWQTYAWSGTPPRWVSGVHLRQYQNHAVIAGRKVDLDDAPIAQWGQWPAQLPDTSTGDDVILYMGGNGEELWDVAQGVAFYDAPGGNKLGTFAHDATVRALGAPLIKGTAPDWPWRPDWHWRQVVVNTGAITGTPDTFGVWVDRSLLTNPRKPDATYSKADVDAAYADAKGKAVAITKKAAADVAAL